MITLEEATEALEALQFFPFGTEHEGTFCIDSRHLPNAPLSDARLCLRKLGFDSRAWQFDASLDDAEQYEQNISIDNLHTQDFSINLRREDLYDVESLLARVADLVAYAMAHEGLEWLRRSDGSHIHDPHIEGDVDIVINRMAVVQ